MQDYKQGKYSDNLGETNFSIAKYGCLITALSDIIEKEPPVTNAILTAHGCFDSNVPLLDSSCASKALGIEYNGKSNTFPDGYDYIIAETDYYAPKNPQHFYVLYKDGSQRDPLGKNIKYPVVSYRLWRGKEVQVADTFDTNFVKNIVNDTDDALASLMDNYDNTQDRAFDFNEAKNGNVAFAVKRIQTYLSAPECKYTLKSNLAGMITQDEFDKQIAQAVQDAIAQTRAEDETVMDEKIAELKTGIPASTPRLTFWEKLRWLLGG